MSFVASCIQRNILGEQDARVAVGVGRLGGFLKKFKKRLDNVYWHRKDDGGVLFGTNFSERLQIT